MTDIPSPGADLPAGAADAGDRIKAVLAGLSNEHAHQVLAALDQLCRPMTAREIERALRAGGLSRSRCDQLATALKGFAILAIMPDCEGVTDDGK